MSNLVIFVYKLISIRHALNLDWWVIHFWFVYVMLLHAWWGFTILLIPPMRADISGGVFWNVYKNTIGLEFWAYFFIFASLLALIAMWLHSFPINTLTNSVLFFSLILLLPQQLIMMISGFGALAHLFGMFYEFETSRVLRVLWLVWGPLIGHTIALLYVAKKYLRETG